MSLSSIVGHAIGNTSTLSAIILNVAQSDPLNKVLTIVLSALSIIYMAIQIYTALPRLKRIWRRRRNKK